MQSKSNLIIWDLTSIKKTEILSIIDNIHDKNNSKNYFLFAYKEGTVSTKHLEEIQNILNHKNNVTFFKSMKSNIERHVFKSTLISHVHNTIRDNEIEYDVITIIANHSYLYNFMNKNIPDKEINYLTTKKERQFSGEMKEMFEKINVIYLSKEDKTNPKASNNEAIEKSNQENKHLVDKLNRKPDAKIKELYNIYEGVSSSKEELIIWDVENISYTTAIEKDLLRLFNTGNEEKHVIYANDALSPKKVKILDKYNWKITHIETSSASAGDQLVDLNIINLINEVIKNKADFNIISIISNDKDFHKSIIELLENNYRVNLHVTNEDLSFKELIKHENNKLLKIYVHGNNTESNIISIKGCTSSSQKVSEDDLNKLNLYKEIIETNNKFIKDKFKDSGLKIEVELFKHLNEIAIKLFNDKNV